MYLVRKNIINDSVDGYFVDEKIHGKLITSHYITLHPDTCSCEFFAKSKNPHTHFHINLVRFWIKQGCPISSMYDKSKDGKIVVLCPGFKS